jgi:hypothetical protein
VLLKTPEEKVSLLRRQDGEDIGSALQPLTDERGEVPDQFLLGDIGLENVIPRLEFSES